MGGAGYADQAVQGGQTGLGGLLSGGLRDVQAGFRQGWTLMTDHPV